MLLKIIIDTLGDLVACLVLSLACCCLVLSLACCCMMVAQAFVKAAVCLENAACKIRGVKCDVK